MYVLFHVVVVATSVTSASSAFFAFAALMTELMIFNKHIYFCMFNKCWCILNHHDQKIWCSHCIHRLSVVIIHTCCAFIKHAHKCEHCFKEKYDYVMNLILRLLQLMMHHARSVIKLKLSWVERNQLNSSLSLSWVAWTQFLLLNIVYYVLKIVYFFSFFSIFFFAINFAINLIENLIERLMRNMIENIVRNMMKIWWEIW